MGAPVFVRFAMAAVFDFVTRELKEGSENVNKAIGFGHVHTNSSISETAYFFIRARVDEVLNCSGERFQNDAVSVIRFTGFVWMKG